MASDTAVVRLRREQKPIGATSRRVLFAPPEPERGTRLGRPKGHVSLNELLQVFWRRKLLIVLVDPRRAGACLHCDAARHAQVRVDRDAHADAEELAQRPRALRSVRHGDAVLRRRRGARARRSPTRNSGSAGRSARSRSRRFKGTGIMKIKARCAKPRLAQLSAAAVTRALLDRVSRPGRDPVTEALRAGRARPADHTGLPAHEADAVRRRAARPRARARRGPAA